jgi:hypothetical protein
VDIDPDLRHDAVSALGDALRWRLSPERWSEVDSVVDRMTSAVRTDDVEELRAAVIDLELAGPVRITRIGDPQARPAPEPVRERVNHLVHDLDEPPHEGGDPAERR